MTSADLPGDIVQTSKGGVGVGVHRRDRHHAQQVELWCQRNLVGEHDHIIDQRAWMKTASRRPACRAPAASPATSCARSTECTVAA